MMELSVEFENKNDGLTLPELTPIELKSSPTNFLSVTSQGFPIAHNTKGNFVTLVCLNSEHYLVKGNNHSTDDDGNVLGMIEAINKVFYNEDADKVYFPNGTNFTHLSSQVIVSFGYLDFIGHETNFDYSTIFNSTMEVDMGMLKSQFICNTQQ
ncbi:MAG: hypothetical protein ACRCXZ_00685 [Patescibacteria group bacterium]